MWCTLYTVRLSHLFAAELSLWVNPGEVSYRVGDHGTVTILYNGQQSGGGVQRRQQSFGASGDCQLRLSLSHSQSRTPLQSVAANALLSPVTCSVFEANSANDLQFTVGSFAMTRFGTTKQKTNLNSLRQIQRNATGTAARKAQAQSKDEPESISRINRPSRRLSLLCIS